MKKKTSLITGSGVLGAYLAKELINRNHKVIVTSRFKKKNYKNYNFLKIQNKITFIKLNILKKNNIYKIIKKFKPNHIFYFSGQSSIVKSYKLKKATFDSNFLGAKNFLEIIKDNKIDTTFYKANSGYIFRPLKGKISLDSKLTNISNPYIKSQIMAYNLVKKFRYKNIKCCSLIFLQIESPLRNNDFFVKKVCLNAKLKNKVLVGNIDSVRDYSWAPEIVKGIYYLTKIKPRDVILSSGKGISGREILKEAYKLNKLNYNDYFKIDKKLVRKNEVKVLIGSKKNYDFLNRNLNFKFKIYKKKLIKKMFQKI